MRAIIINYDEDTLQIDSAEYKTEDEAFVQKILFRISPDGDWTRNPRIVPLRLPELQF